MTGTERKTVVTWYITKPATTSSVTGVYGAEKVNVTMVFAVGFVVDVADRAVTVRSGSRTSPAHEFVGAPEPATEQTSRMADTVSLPRSTPSGKTRMVPETSAA